MKEVLREHGSEKKCGTREKIKEIREELKRKYPDGYILDETEWLAMNPRRMAEEEGLDFDELRERILQRFSE